jgi:hypothetical protein
MPILLAVMVLLAATTAPSSAATCSHWKKVCDSRAGGAACDAKFQKCLKDGSWQEGDKWGGKTHTGLGKK